MAPLGAENFHGGRRAKKRMLHVKKARSARLRTLAQESSCWQRCSQSLPEQLTRAAAPHAQPRGVVAQATPHPRRPRRPRRPDPPPPRRLTIADSPPPRPVATAGRLSGVGSFMGPATA